jgi:hypothetical protein
VKSIGKMLRAVISLIGINFCSLAQAPAIEKPVILKGLSIGMNLKDARLKVESLFGKGWVVTEIGKTVELEEYGDYNVLQYEKGIWSNERGGLNQQVMGRVGFAVKNKKGFCHGYIGSEEYDGKVLRIAFDGKLIDHMLAATKTSADEFVEQFTENYNLPAFNWIQGGWIYSSKYGYKITIRVDKFFELASINDPAIAAALDKPKLKFE